MSTIYIYKTDTVWGIGQSIYDEKSFNEIALSKGTTNDKPLSILFSNYEELVQYFQLPKEMNENWFADMAKLEMSFLLPVQWLKKEIPSFNFGNKSSGFKSASADFSAISKVSSGDNKSFANFSLA